MKNKKDTGEGTMSREFIPTICKGCDAPLKNVHLSHGVCEYCGREWLAVNRYNGPDIPEEYLKDELEFQFNSYGSTAVGTVANLRLFTSSAPYLHNGLYNGQKDE